jgi:hypothetical protein
VDTPTPTNTPLPTATPTVFIPVTGNISLLPLCTDVQGTINWQVNNSNAFDISFVWWVVGGSATGGPVSVTASSSISLQTPSNSPTTVAIMWFDPSDGSFKTITETNPDDACDGSGPTATPTPTPPPDVLIPVTGVDLPSLFRDSMFLNMGIGIFGFALILLGIGIKLDKGKVDKDDEDEDDE